jgi:hypothetical protein
VAGHRSPQAQAPRTWASARPRFVALCNLGSNLGSNVSSTEVHSTRLHPSKHGGQQLKTTQTLGLGAGRSQVQILSPRLTKSLQMRYFYALRYIANGSTGTNTGTNICLRHTSQGWPGGGSSSTVPVRRHPETHRSSDSARLCDGRRLAGHEAPPGPAVLPISTSSGLGEGPGRPALGS